MEISINLPKTGMINFPVELAFFIFMAGAIYSWTFSLKLFSDQSNELKDLKYINKVKLGVLT
jgi:hypothetical protein